MKKCGTCGASMEPRKETLCRRLCDALVQLDAAGAGEFHPRKQLNLDHVSWNVFQKLQYWGLIAKGERSGYWAMTYTGRRFVAGLVAVPKVVFVLRNGVVGEGEVDVTIRDFLPYDDPAWKAYA